MLNLSHKREQARLMLILKMTNFQKSWYQNVVDMDFYVLRPKKCGLLTVLTLLTGQNYVFKTRNLCVDIVDMDFCGAINKLSC